MRADRLGSYSMEATLAGTPSLFRLKSIRRYCRLCPPPWWRAVIRPWSFRPARFRIPTVKPFSGFVRESSEKSETLAPRRPGVVGLYLRTGIGLRTLRLEDLDGVAAGQGDQRPLLTTATPAPPAPPPAWDPGQRGRPTPGR